MMNKEQLKKMIQEVILENRQKTVLLSSPLNEATAWTQYGRVMDMFTGDVESVDQIVIMTPENPHAKPLTAKQNAARVKVFKQEMASAGYGYRKVEGMYEGPEDSFVIPHMSKEDAARFCYKYGQESFVYSVKQEGAEAKMLHELVVINYDKPEQDPAYPIEEYGPVYVVPSQVSTTVDAEATKVLNMQDLHKAPDYYSNIPGDPEGTRFSMDFYGDKEKGTAIGAPRSPRYIREGTFVRVLETEVPKTDIASELVQSIRNRCKMINESDRMGSSKYHHRKMILVEKKKLKEIIKEQNGLSKND